MADKYTFENYFSDARYGVRITFWTLFGAPLLVLAFPFWLLGMSARDSATTYLPDPPRGEKGTD